jgi:hypothetical protein
MSGYGTFSPQYGSDSVQNLLSSRLLSKNANIRIYKTIILPLVLYGCETWYVILSEEHRLRVSENRVLRRIFGPKRDEVMGGWRKLHNEELRDLYSSPSIIKMYLGERGWGGVDWIDLAQDRNRWRALVNSVMNLRVL